MREPQNYFADDQTAIVTLPSDVVEQIDENLGGAFKSRTEFIRAATNAYIVAKGEASMSSSHIRSPLATV